MNQDEKLAATIAKHGWAAAAVQDCPTPFVYTSGLLTTFQHPELMIFYSPARKGYDLLALMIQDIRGGKSFAAEASYPDILANFDIATRSIHATQHELYLADALAHCRYACTPGGLKALQVFWPDDKGRFPFEAGCDKAVIASQPLLNIQLSQAELRDFKRKWGIE